MIMDVFFFDIQDINALLECFWRCIGSKFLSKHVLNLIVSCEDHFRNVVYIGSSIIIIIESRKEAFNISLSQVSINNIFFTFAEYKILQLINSDIAIFVWRNFFLQLIIKSSLISKLPFQFPVHLNQFALDALYYILRHFLLVKYCVIVIIDSWRLEEVTHLCWLQWSNRLLG